MTCPLPFNSTSPLSSKSNVPNLSNIHFVASEICIRSAIYYTYKNIQKLLKLEFIRTRARDSIYFYNYIFFHEVDIIFFNFFKTTYVNLKTPFSMQYLLYHQKDNNVAFFAQLHLRRLVRYVHQF